MADNLTQSQRELDNALFEVNDAQRTFSSNYANVPYVIRQKMAFEITVAAASGLVLGGLIGAVLGMRRS